MPHLQHGYYYDPYYYYDWYHHTPGSDAVGVVLFLIFLFAIFWLLFVCWGDTNKKKKKKRVDYTPAQPQPTVLRPVQPLVPVRAPKLVVPKVVPKPVKPYIPINPMAEATAVEMDTERRGWDDKQIDLVKRINTNSFFKMLQNEIRNKLKQRKNPRAIAQALIVLRKQLVKNETDVDFLQTYIDMNIFNIQKTDIENIKAENRLLAIDIIARLTGYVRGYKDLPDKIMLWVTDFIV